ncbi:hypothetical protein C7S18_23805 (plasmid) [Ahniella affigens]|uniref:Uncharacterized protein n=1 Tax=Ahniella affigens TaxID=2021234 RepID=A0A2P1PZR5_9GAMM|nr:hypothetical protein C7S18_23805 [Ahniella affigens]
MHDSRLARSQIQIIRWRQDETLASHRQRPDERMHLLVVMSADAIEALRVCGAVWALAGYMCRIICVSA